MNRIIITVFSLLCACGFVSEGVPMDESSSSSSSDDSHDPTIVTTVTTSTSTPATTSDVSSSDDDSGSDEGESSSSSGEETSTESTGERAADYALSFDGTSYARKVEDDAFMWPSGDFTVEAWIDIQNEDATGVIFDTTDVGFTSGWVLYLHNDFHALVFSVFDETHYNQVVIGPDVAEIGTGWHHIAATKSDSSATIHVDGVSVVVQQVSPTMSFDNDAPWSLGGNSVDNEDFRLQDVVVDDVRITGEAIYAQDFIPPQVYDQDDATILALTLDEGDGDVATDGDAEFTINGAVWVDGNTEK